MTNTIYCTINNYFSTLFLNNLFTAFLFIFGSGRYIHNNDINNNDINNNDINNNDINNNDINNNDVEKMIKKQPNPQIKSAKSEQRVTFSMGYFFNNKC
ncbi:hypothetical protein [Marinibactrum halimedae]|uniref:hypothetical protein n=1 Tax=Marinibactrum halimedae TaxID=1444977 RepID=UPI001E2C7DF4|nr:hypothetical protein [Marinibactrum halimedae]MCD9461201.1 hypothetical protein [Marinibactrum halimedae]